MLNCLVLIVIKFSVIYVLFLQQFVMTFGKISCIRKQPEVRGKISLNYLYPKQSKNIKNVLFLNEVKMLVFETKKRHISDPTFSSRS